MSNDEQQRATQAERGARIIKLATEIMQAGKSKGWSHALSLAARRTP